LKTIGRVKKIYFGDKDGPLKSMSAVTVPPLALPINPGLRTIPVAFSVERVVVIILCHVL